MSYYKAFELQRFIRKGAKFIFRRVREFRLLAVRVCGNRRVEDPFMGALTDVDTAAQQVAATYRRCLTTAKSDSTA